MEQKTVYLAGDVDAIKDFVFETSSLPQIRGGSELLQECEEEIQGSLAQRLGYQVIYCAGGSFLLEVPADRADEVKKAIEDLYQKKTLVATVTIVADRETPPTVRTPLSFSQGEWANRLWQAAEGVLQDGGFAHRLLFLQSRMQEAKTARATAPFYEAFPFGRRCERCGKRMAQEREPLEEEGKALCAVCERRAEKGRKRQGEVRGRFNREFQERYEKEIRADQPKDLDTLLQSSSRKYLAFLYADGNDIGKLLQRVQRPDRYRLISKALTEGTKEALFQALWHVCGTELQRRNRPWPFEIINIGGDDVIVLLQAGYAWEVAVEFLKRFEQEVNERLRQGPEPHDGYPITASCGIAIADAKYPIRYLERLAADLLKRAKKRAKENPAAPKSAVNFLWLPTPIASERVEPVMGVYHLAEDSYLTARPYTLEEAQGMDEVARKISKLPQATRHRWAEALAKGVLFSLSFIQYDLALDEKHRPEMLWILGRLGQIMAGRNPSTPHPLPIWHQLREDDRIVWRTALLDALELAELQAMRPETG